MNPVSKVQPLPELRPPTGIVGIFVALAQPA